MAFKKIAKIYWFAAAATAFIWTLVGLGSGFSALLTVIVLTLLETTFSADNAIVNSKVLVTLSPFWRRIFMTIGVFIAVFVVRFALPIIIVMLGADVGFHQVVTLALHHPHQYKQELTKAEPAINAFGGVFLLMVALDYFIDYSKKIHWLFHLERGLGALGRFKYAAVSIMLSVSLVLFMTTSPAHRATIFWAALAAIGLHIGLGLLETAMSDTINNEKKPAKFRVGGAAFATFAYLEILDASFSLDGVIGAFAITSSVVLIIAGLGAGAMWVRAMTVHLVTSQTLSKYIYLEHGAHWAIAFLGSVMFLKLYEIVLPQWFVGSLGLACISAAILWSKRESGHKMQLS